MKTGKKLALLVACTTLAASLPIHAAALIGDLNGDGVVDAADAKKLAEYFAGYGHEIDPVAADVDIDGDVDRKDGMTLSRYADGWDGYEMPTEEEAAAAIYTKELDEEHIQTGMLTYEEETYEGMYVNNEIIVVVDEDIVGREYVEMLVKPYGGTVVGQVPVVGFYQVEIEGEPTLEELEGIIDTVFGVEYVEDVYLNHVSEYSIAAYKPQDPFNKTDTYDESIWDSGYNTWHLRAANVPEAWELVLNQNPEPYIKIGIVDDLFDTRHEDLKDNLIVMHYADPSINVTDYPEYGVHGTHVAGIIGAKQNNGIGVAGVALGAQIYARTTQDKASDKNCYTSTSTWVEDIVALIEQGCQIINLSMGQDGMYNNIIKLGVSIDADKLSDLLVKDNISKRKYLLITGAGNRGEKTHDVNWFNMMTAIDETSLKDRIIVVGNADYSGVYSDSDFFADFVRYKSSSFVGGRVDVMAPGCAIYSTVPTSSYDRMWGTSMASPFVAGVAALVWEANPELTPEEVKEIIVSTANIEVTNCTPEMINAEAAVQEAINRIEAKPIASGTCGDNLTWTLDEAGTLTISGTGDMWDFDTGVPVYHELPWDEYTFDTIRRINVQNGVTSIGNEAFRACFELTSISIADTVTRIGDYALAYAGSYGASLEIYLSENVSKIGEAAFIGSTGLIAIHVDVNNKQYCSIDGVLFSKDMKSLLVYPAMRQYGGNYIVPDGVTTICTSAFSNAQISGVILPEGILRIEESAFSCALEDEIILPDSLEYIGAGAFYSNAFTSISIPVNVSYIDPTAFKECFTLEQIQVNSDNPYYCSVDGVLYSKDLKTLRIYPEGKKDSVFTIPSGTKEAYLIDIFTSNNGTLTTVYVPESVEKLWCDSWYDGINIYVYSNYETFVKNIYFYGKIPKLGLYNKYFDLTLHYLEGQNGWTSPTITINGTTYNTATWTP